MTPDYTLIRASRKTLSLRLEPDGSITVRAPRFLPRREIDRFVASKADWIEAHRARLAARSSLPPLTEEEIEALKAKARQVIPPRVAQLAPLVGVGYGRISIRHQKTRWGSCSAEGNLNFNCLLMLAPPEVLDSVILHELCHRLEMNHSPRFYAALYRVCPDYDRCRRWLREEGAALMAR